MTDNYPREWFRVTRWGGDIEARIFVRETAAKLVYMSGSREMMIAKSTSYDQWFPTREEAESVIAERRARKEADAAEKRIRDAAPDLLAALEGLVEAVRFDVNKERRLRIAEDLIARLSQPPEHG